MPPTSQRRTLDGDAIALDGNARLLKALCSEVRIEDPGRIEIVRTLGINRDAIAIDSNASAAQQRPDPSDRAMAIAESVFVVLLF